MLHVIIYCWLLLQFIQIHPDKSFHSVGRVEGLWPLFISLGPASLHQQFSCPVFWEEQGRELRWEQSHQESWLACFIFFVLIKTTALGTSFLHNIFYFYELHYVYTTWFCLLFAPWGYMALPLWFRKYHLSFKWSNYFSQKLCFYNVFHQFKLKKWLSRE